MKVLVIPDTQVKPGVPTKHISALGNWIEDQRPDRIICIGDWFDMRSCSNYVSATELEGMRVIDDLEYGKSAMDSLWKPLERRNRQFSQWKKKKYQPDCHFAFGNHELQYARLWERDPRLIGTLSMKDFDLEKRWTVHDFNDPFYLDGIAYSHYFANPASSRPIGGQIANKIKNIGCSFIQGHNQHFEYGEMTMGSGKLYSGMVCGSFYSHPEGYKGFTGNNHWRGVPILHDVKDGCYDLEKMSIDRLIENYG